jgi:hypothetical protein
MLSSPMIVLLSILAVLQNASSSPVPAPIAVPASLQATKFASAADFPVNVIFVSGPAQFGMWVPRDGVFYSTASLTCLNMPAYTYGACSIPTVDQIGVVAGNGPCSFVGSNGFWNTIQGTAGEGFYTVGPPQVITYVSCG